LLRELFDDVVAEIARIDPTGVSAASYRQRRIKRLFNSIEALTGKAFDEEFKLLRHDLAGIGKHQALWAADQLAGTIGAVDIAISRGGLGVNTMKAILDADPFQGETLKGWVKSGRGAASRRIRRAIQIGMTENDTLDQIVRRIRGRSNGRGGFVGGAMRTTTREAEALARTGVNFIATRGHMLTYEQNADVLSGVKFTATLDGDTSLRCRALDTNVFKLDDPDKPQFPLHWRERSVYTPVVDWEGLGLEPPKEGMRASADGQVPASTSYSDWFRNQSKAEQDRIIGPARAQLFRDGKISFRDMVAGDGRTLTLEELEAKG